MVVISKAELSITSTSCDVRKSPVAVTNNSSEKKTQDVFNKKSSLTPPGDWSKFVSLEEEYKFYEFYLSRIKNADGSVCTGKKSTPEEERNFHIKLLMEEKGVSEEAAVAEYDYYN